MSDEWRVEVDLDDEQHGFTVGERLRSLDLDDEARERLGDRVVITRDGAKMFLYAGDEAQAREAERVTRELVASEGLSAEFRVTRWHPDEEAWKDPAEAPEGSTVHLGTAGAPHPVFVFLGAHTPGIARDLGL